MGKKKENKQINIEEIVDDILANMDDKTKKILAKAKPDAFGSYASEFHFGLGTQIRNNYGLWSYGNADDLSYFIINRLVMRIKQEST